MEGVVLSTTNLGNDFIIWFGEGGQEAYVVVRNMFYLGAEGNCLHIVGMVQEDAEGKVFIRADDPDQIDQCPSKP
jgi:hypothetical protein